MTAEHVINAPIVAVRGEVVREVDPELATFSVTAHARDKDRQATLTRLTQRHEAVRAVLDGYGEAIDKRETGRVSVYPETRRRGERATMYVGGVSTVVTLTDFTALGDLMVRLSETDQVSVSGPWWSLRPDSPVYAAARRDAVTAAVARAREYAEALGARVVRLVELADSGLGGGAEATTMRFAVGGAMGGGDGGSPQLELDPQRQTVHGTVEARFEISEPATLG